MSWLHTTMNSTLGKKVLMALTGLFLILFLVIHLLGNLQLLLPDQGAAFNIYAHNMASNPLIRVVSILNFAFILTHVVYSIVLTRLNKNARPVGYAVPNKKSAWASRNMGILGTIILLFIIIHLKGFWYELKFGKVPFVEIDGIMMKNGFALVQAAYSNPIYSLIYVIAMVFLGFHLSHGFQSAFQTLGLNHNKYTTFIKKTGLAFSILIPGLFAMIPIIMYLKSIT